MTDRFHALIRGDHRGPAAALQRAGLWALSLPYGAAVRLRNRAFDRGWKASASADVPVVSVGNLTVGGTGKTPCVEYVARFYRGQGRRVAILSRGYGNEHGPNDEALVLEENLPDVPHLQGADRVELARVAVEELESEVLVLDDGFQHRRLKRDLDLVLIDATQPWGHGYLLPRGLLREPMSGLKRAGAVLLTRCDLVTPAEVQAIKQQVSRHAPNVPTAESTHRPAAWINASRTTAPLESLHGRPVAAFCGLGNPAAFRQSLLNLGLTVVDWRTFPDHHPYSREDIDDLRQWARRQPADAVMATTQKDLVKIRLDRLGDRDLWALQIQLDVHAGAEALESALQRSTPGERGT